MYLFIDKYCVPEHHMDECKKFTSDASEFAVIDCILGRDRYVIVNF